MMEGPRSTDGRAGKRKLHTDPALSPDIFPMPNTTTVADGVVVTLDQDLKEALRERTEQESEELRRAVEGDGCFTDPLVLWAHDGRNLLVDGYGRMEVWQALPDDTPIPPPAVRFKQFPDRDAAKAWAIRRQLGRRNLKPKEASTLRGRLYLVLRNSHGGNRLTAKGQNDPLLKNGQLQDTTAASVAKSTGVSSRTVKRDAAYVEGLDKIKAADAQLAADVQSGAVKLKKPLVCRIGKLAAAQVSEVAARIKSGQPWKDILDAQVPRSCKRCTRIGTRTEGCEQCRELDRRAKERDEKRKNRAARRKSGKTLSKSKAVEDAFCALVRALDKWLDQWGRCREYEECDRLVKESHTAWRRWLKVTA